MSLRRTLLLAALISMAPTALVVAQTNPQTDTTSPSSASSPHQRDATSSSTPEASSTDNTTSSTNPSAASTPHQQQSTHMASKQSMKDCIAKQQSDNQGMSKTDAKKACKAQLKGNSG
jgi:hypothetical protein